MAGSSLLVATTLAARGTGTVGEAEKAEAPPPSALSGLKDIDMYFGDWRHSAPRLTHGSLQERDILTRGDALNPTRKGAVLRFLNSYTCATLAPRASTMPTRLHGQQEIFYTFSGRGTAAAGGQTVGLSPNVVVLMPANLEFTIQNTGDKPLAMYVINEPTPPGFRPNAKMLVRDENTLPITSSDGFWCHIVKTLYTTAEGLGTLQSVLTVTLDPLTLGKPHNESHDDIEEVWSALEGTSIAWIGVQLRRQPPGVAYLHPPGTEKTPDNKTLGTTPHTNINDDSARQSKFLYFARYHPHEPRP
ncbi:MAG: cupin domain-containing protein [Terriglobia bacterium]